MEPQHRSWFAANPLRTRRSPASIGLKLVLLLLAVAYGYVEYRDPSGSIRAFWEAGNDFWHGRSLYPAGEVAIDDVPYLYPPFFAMSFGALSWMPLPLTAAVFNFLNLWFWVGCAALVRRCLLLSGVADEATTRKATIVAVILSLKFFHNNMIHAQVNALVLLLTLGGVYCHQRRKHWGSALLLCAATWCKFTPVFVIVWTFVRAPRATLRPLASATLAGLLLPAVIRGAITGNLGQGLADLQQLRFVMSQAFGGADALFRSFNQSIPSLIHRLFLRLPSGQLYGGHRGDGSGRMLLVELPPDAVQWLVRIVALGALLVFAVVLARQLRRRAPISMLEISMALLIPYLVSGITWKSHLVSLIVLYAALLVDPVGRSSGWLRTCRWGLLASALGLMLTGRALVGRSIHVALDDLGLHAWFILSAYAFCALALLTQGRVRCGRAGETVLPNRAATTGGDLAET